MYAFAFVAQNFINYHFVDIFHDSDLQRIIGNKLKRLAKNQSAVNALNALKAEIKAKRQRYEAIRKAWDTHDKKAIVNLGKTPFFDDENLKFLSGKELFISGDTIERHRDPNDTSANTHKEITPFDYSLISYMFENNAFLGLFTDKNPQGKFKNYYLNINKLDVYYRLCIEVKDEIEVKSLLARKTMEILDETKRNKTAIWVKE